MSRVSSALLLALLWAGCTEAETPGADVVSSSVAGRIYAPTGWVTEGTVRVFTSLAPDAERACEVRVEGGQFLCELGPLSGDLLVRVEFDEGRLDAVVRGLELGESRDGTIVSAVTHFDAQYARFRGGADSRLVYEHFGGLAHDSIEPGVSEDAARPAKSAGILNHALGTLAERLRDDSDPAVRWTAMRLVGMLGDDLGADGLWDGEGPAGALRFSRRTITGSTLRAEYARAILSWLLSPENATGISRGEWVASAEAITQRQSELFSAPGEALDIEGPEVFGVELHTEATAELPPNTVGRSFRVSFGVRDLVGVTHAEVELGARRIRAAKAGERYRATLSSSDLSDGANMLALVAYDLAGNTGTATTGFEIDTTPPVVEAAVYASADGALRVVGTVQDGHGLGPVELSVGDTVESIQAESDGGFVWEPGRPCDESELVRVEVEDGLGNLARRDFAPDCRTDVFEIRLLPTAYYPATMIEAAASPSGPTYAPVPGARSVSVGEQTTWPTVFSKYVTRLDADSENRVRVRFVAPPGSEVSYRWLVEQDVRREWTELASVDDDVFEVPLSYQALGPALGRLAPTEPQTLELRATRGAENVIRGLVFRMSLESPPLLVDDCSSSPLSGVGLPEQNLHGLFVEGTEPSMFRARLVWAPGVEQTSLAPVASVEVDPRGAISITGRAAAFREDLHWGQLVPNDVSNFPYWCPAGHHLFAVSGPTSVAIAVDSLACGSSDWACAFQHCVPGIRTQDEVFWDEEVDGAAPGWSRINREGSASVWRGPVELDVFEGGYRVDRQPGYELLVRMKAERHEIGGEPYQWGAALELPAGFTPSSGPARYRVPGFTRVGINFEAPGTPTSARSWASAGYLSRFEFEAEEPRLHARLLENSSIAVPVVYAESCEFVYATETL